MANRTDIHRPSTLVPADYVLDDYFGHWRVPGEIGPQDEAVYEYYGEEVVAYYHDHPEPMADTPWAGASHRCDVCGARYVHGALFTHTPTGQLVTMGQDCAETYLGAARLTDNQRGMRASRTARRRLAWGRIRQTLIAHPGLNAALKAHHHISEDLRGKFIRTGKLSEAQVALAFKLKAQADRWAEREAEEAKLNWIAVPDTGKRFKVQGTILGFKDDEGYMGEPVTKMLVRAEHDGGFFKLYGSFTDTMYDLMNRDHYEAEAARREASQLWLEQHGVSYSSQLSDELDEQHRKEWHALDDEIPPTRTLNDLRGTRITFMARLERSKKDDGFGFYSRPTKVVLED
jgi:hypothetical protein